MTAFQCALKGLLCIRNVRDLVVGELLPNGLEQKTQSPRRSMTTLRSCQGDVGRWLSATFRPWDWWLEINSQVPGDPWCMPVKKGIVWSQTERQKPPTARSYLCPSSGRGTPAQEHVATWHFSVFNCLTVFSKSLMKWLVQRSVCALWKCLCTFYPF